METEYINNSNTENSLVDNKMTNINNILENNTTSEITINLEKMPKYDHNKKIELKKKIEKIKKKECLIDIFHILTSDKEEYTENNNGVFFFFHDLSDEIYEKVENYVNNIYRLYKTNNTTNMFNSEISETANTNSYNYIDKNLSNKEKNFVKKKNYEEYLERNQEN